MTCFLPLYMIEYTKKIRYIGEGAGAAMKNALGKVMCRALAALFSFLLVFSFFACSGSGYHTARLYAMGTFCSFTVEGAEGEDGDVTPTLASLLSEVENALSHRHENSVAARLNRGEWVTVSDPLRAALALSEEVKEKTGGLFSISLLPITSLWHFDDEAPVPPTDAALAAALAQTENSALLFEGNAVCRVGGDVDLGAIGKGYACDLLSDALRARGETGLLAVGGSLAAVGSKGDTPWRVGVRDPFSASQNDLIGTLALTDTCVSTSGSYEKTFTYEGKSYHHILNPQTGLPVESDLVSVTVVAKSGVLTDILSTACFLVGSEDALALAAEYGAAVLLVKADGTLTANAAMAAIFTPAGGREVAVP